MVRKGGVEPPKPFGYRILSPARLPIPPLSLGNGCAPSECTTRMLPSPHNDMVPELPGAGVTGAPIVTIVAPCYNEAPVIDDFYAALRRAVDSLPGLAIRFVFVDDGSSDATLEKLHAIAARDARVKVYSLSRNFGHQIALSAGLDVAAGDAVIMMDADLQHPPSLIPELVRQWQAGHDVVSAVRTATSDASLLKRITARGFYWLINRLSDVEIVPGAADFCLLSGRAHRALSSMPERHRFLRGMVSWIGFRRTYVPYEAAARAAGVSKYTWLKMVVFSIDALLSFSAAPMRVASRFGAMLVVPGVIYLIYIVVRYFAVGDLVQGWGSTLSVLLIIGGTQLVFIGLIGEYLARIFEQTKQRPLYLFKYTPGDRA
jgi:glycosyltransferase involved in cell wall biosynthesis